MISDEVGLDPTPKIVVIIFVVVGGGRVQIFRDLFVFCCCCFLFFVFFFMKTHSSPYPTAARKCGGQADVDVP